MHNAGIRLPPRLGSGNNGETDRQIRLNESSDAMLFYKGAQGKATGNELDGLLEAAQDHNGGGDGLRDWLKARGGYEGVAASLGHGGAGPANAAAPPVDSYGGGNNPLMLLLSKIEELLTRLLQPFQPFQDLRALRDLRPQAQGGGPGGGPAGAQEAPQPATGGPFSLPPQRRSAADLEKLADEYVLGLKAHPEGGGNGPAPSQLTGELQKLVYQKLGYPVPNYNSLE